MRGALSPLKLSGFLAGLAIATSATPTEVAGYTYDALGRLVATAVTSGIRNGEQTSTAFDPAGNRGNYTVGPPGAPQGNAAVFSISGGAVVTEGQSAAFTISKTGSAVSTLTVAYGTANGTAAAPGDFTALSGIVSFKSWETIKNIIVATINDGISEPAESFSVTLSSPAVGASLGTASADAIIQANGTANQPPQTVADATLVVGVGLSGTLNVIANDTDPEGNYPLTLVSVTSNTNNQYGSPYVNSSQEIGFSGGCAPGNDQVTYTVSDSLGATATGLVAVRVNAGQGCD